MSFSASQPDDRNERALLAAFRSGDLRAFETIYRSKVEILCRYAATFVSGDDARDVVQDVFWATWNARERLAFVTDAELSQYLFRAVRNRAFNLVHRAQIHQQYIADQDRISAQHTAEDGVEHTDRSDTDTLLSRVNALIEVLPPRSREVLLLRWHHGLDLEAIASIMEISYGSVRVLHARALAMLRNRLDLATDEDGGG